MATIEFMLARLRNVGKTEAVPGRTARPRLDFSRFLFGLVILPALILVFGANLEAADISLYQITKGIKYLQTNASTPAEIFPNGYPFSADVYPVVANWVTGASIESPGTYAFLALESDGVHYEWQRSFNTLAGLDANYANGVYLLDISAVHDGSRRLQIPLQGSAYPNIPRISNFVASQNVYANGYCLLAWDRFNAGTTADLIRFTVEDTNGNQFYQTAGVGEQQALNGTATWVLLEPGQFKTNSNYIAKLLFQKNVTVDRTGYPGAAGVTAYAKETQFKLVTLPASGPEFKDIEVAKSLRWLQTSDTAPVPEPKSAQFSATAGLYQTSAVATATLVLPTIPAYTNNLKPDANNLLNLRVVDQRANAADLDATWGMGTYTLNLSNRQDGVKSLTFNLQSVTNAPQPPQVVGYGSLQNVRASKPFTVSWFPWTNSTVNDFIQLTIRDTNGTKVFATPDLGSPNALHGLATNAVVRAGALAGGQTNNAQLVFRRNASLDTTNYPGVLSLADYHSQTSFDILTAPADIASYEIVKGQVFRQADTNAPRPIPTNGYSFTALLVGLNRSSISNATLTTPSNISMTLAPAGQTSWAFTDLTSQNSAYPAGSYRLSVNCANDGIQNLDLSLPGSFPPAPHLLDYDQLRDATNGFYLAWDAFSTPNPGAIIQLTIRESSGQVVISNTLSSLAVNCFVPSVVLSPSTFYQGSLIFATVHITNAPAYRQTSGRVTLASETQFTFGTSGPGNPPVLTASRDAASGGLLFKADVVSNQKYRVEYSTNLPPHWLPLVTNSSASNVLWFADPSTSVRPRTFYRILWP